MPNMKAALHDGATGLRVLEVRRPEASPGTVVLKVHASGVCGSDLYYYGIRAEPETVPGGHEVAGEVVQVGPGVEHMNVGDHVAVECVGKARACGNCWYCRAGQYVQCLNQRPHLGGGFAEYMNARAQGCFVLSPRLSWEEGALVEPLAVGVHAGRRANIRPHETAVVLGAGTIGLACVAAARVMGAGRTIVAARYPYQASLARELGADVAVSGDGDALSQAAAQATEGRGADVTFEGVGGTGPEALAQAIAVTRKQGRIVSVGVPKVPVSVNLITLLRKEQTLVMAHCYGVLDGRHDFDLAIDLMASGRVPFHKIVTHRFPLSQIDQAFATARSRAAGPVKVLVTP